MYKLIEKGNPLAVHGLFETKQRAEYHLENLIPVFVSRGYFDNKSLTANSFEIVDMREEIYHENS